MKKYRIIIQDTTKNILIADFNTLEIAKMFLEEFGEENTYITDKNCKVDEDRRVQYARYYIPEDEMLEMLGGF